MPSWYPAAAAGDAGEGLVQAAVVALGRHLEAKSVERWQYASELEAFPARW